MSADALRDALLRAVLARPIIADTMEDGLDVLIKRLGGEMSRATVVAAVQEVVASGLAYEPVWLPPGAPQRHRHLELSPRGQEAALQA